MRWLLFGVVLASVSCGGAARIGGERSAAAGLRSYIDALRDDNARRAYDMLTDETRRAISYERFAVTWRETEGERRAQAKALEEELRAGPDLGERAQVRYGDGKTVSLIRENGRWRLEASLVARAHASRPVDAVRILAEALASRDYDALMRALTARRRNGITREVDRFSTSLIEHLGSEISIIGPDRAELTWDTDTTRYKLILRKEGQEWRVDDIHIRPRESAP
jgi:hypothetical protein